MTVPEIWSTGRGPTGEWLIKDEAGWTFATLHYDYAHTCAAVRRGMLQTQW